MKNKKIVAIICLATLLLACKKEKTYPSFNKWQAYDETELIEESQKNENPSLRYKLIQSKISDKNDLLNVVQPQLENFTEDTYKKIAPFVFEKSIAEIQEFIEADKISYKLLTQWYLYRIVITETNADLSLNAIISVNPNAVKEAEKLDKNKANKQHPIFGMPIVLKDNINTKNIKTTAGAAFLIDHQPKEDATIVKHLKSNGAIILGKANLSEWANFLCAGCPNGYSAVGGQTLNPYGIRKFDTGGSSSGSAVSTAVNYAVGAVGTETSGSILSPSSQQSVVGLKPTLGSLSQDGIIPISSTLDTPGPITKNTLDNFILYDAMQNKNSEFKLHLEEEIQAPNQIRLGIIESLMEDSLYRETVIKLEEDGFHIELISPENMDFSGFLELLNGDMKRDLASYFKEFKSKPKTSENVKDVVEFNKTDSINYIPYGQARLDGILAQNLSDEQVDSVRINLLNAGKTYFETHFKSHQLDAILSINNYHAGQAAVAKYPAITVPMGYKNTGEPQGLTFIGKPNQEELLLKLTYLFEKIETKRQRPEKYKL